MQPYEKFDFPLYTDAPRGRSLLTGGSHDVESTELNSKALRQAALRSDRIRIIAILIVLCLLFVFTVARRLVLEGIDGARGLAIFASFFGAMIAYEVATLRRVTRALERERNRTLPVGSATSSSRRSFRPSASACSSPWA